MPRRTHTTEFMLAFGERMRGLRHEFGFSLSQLSEATGISKGHLSTIELGFAAITTESVERIAIGLDVPPMFLFAFPKDNEYAVILDLVRKIPTTHHKKLQKLLKRWIEELEIEE